MHGAAQTAKAPPSSRPSRAPRARCSSPGATARSGHGSSPDEREPEHDEHEAGDLESASAWSTTLADRRAPRRRAATKTTVKPTMNGRLASTIRRADAALAEPRHLDRRHRREVARDERQYARRDHRDEPGEERDRELLKHRSRCELRVEPRFVLGRRAPSRRLGLSRRRRALARPVPGPAAEPDARRAGCRRSAAPRRAGRSRGSRASRARRAEFATISSRICCFAPALRDPPADLGLHLLRDRRVRLVEGLVADRADELRLEIGLRSGASRASAGAGKGEREQHARASSLMPAARDGRRSRASRRSTGPSTCVDDPPAAVDEERLRRGRDAPRADRRRRSGRKPSDRWRGSAW